ncbi:hypothetical protein [Wolinella succinogenes]|nr:hypothetical protein [Wolinella succinogenes]
MQKKDYSESPKTADDFVSSATGETALSEIKKSKKKLVTVYLSLEIIDRLNLFVETEAKRSESKSVIVEKALEMFLESRLSK